MLIRAMIPARNFTPDLNTEQVVEHFEKHLAPTISFQAGAGQARKVGRELGGGPRAHHALGHADAPAPVRAARHRDAHRAAAAGRGDPLHARRIGADAGFHALHQTPRAHGHHASARVGVSRRPGRLPGIRGFVSRVWARCRPRPTSPRRSEADPQCRLRPHLRRERPLFRQHPAAAEGQIEPGPAVEDQSADVQARAWVCMRRANSCTSIKPGVQAVRRAGRRRRKPGQHQQRLEPREVSERRLQGVHRRQGSRREPGDAGVVAGVAVRRANSRRAQS